MVLEKIQIWGPSFLSNGLVIDITPECTTVSGGPQEGVPCILPFGFKGKVRNECILEKGEDKPWCSTKVNKRGAHIGGQKQWGYCGPQCPVAPKGTLG